MPYPKTLLTLALVALCAVAQTAPDQVTVEVAATDKSGFAKNLPAGNFKLWEDNKEQTVASAVVRAPGKHAIVLLFDDTTVPVRIQGDIRSYVEHFIDAAAGPRNYMEVASFFSGIRVLQPFTTDPALLKTALGSTEASAVLNSGRVDSSDGATSSAASSGRGGSATSRAGSNQVRNGAQVTGGTASPENEMKTEAMMESFRGLVESLAPIKGRKAIVLFSGGQSFSQEVTKYVDKVLDEANKNNVAIYGIAASVDNSGIAFVKTFADATGGTSVKQTPNLPDALKQILEEQEEYYAVTFTPNNAGDPAGVCHQLRVKIETPGVEARSRKSYCAKNSDALVGTPTGKELDARLAGTAAGSLGASLQAPYFYGESNASQARVNVVLDTATSGIVFHKEKGKEHGELNAEGIAYRADGSVAARFSETLPFDFADQKNADAFAKLPFHYENQLWLQPGQYTIKTVLSPSADIWGKAEQKISVEPRDAGKLSMSGIALSRELRDAKGGVAGLPADMIEGQTPLIASGKEIVPTGSDRFQRGERAFFYTEVYDPALAGANPPQISMRFRVLDRASGAVKSDSGAASIAGYVKAGNPIVGVASTVPETSLGPGAYRLEVTTTHSSGPEAVVRSVDFDLN